MSLSAVTGGLLWTLLLHVSTGFEIINEPDYSHLLYGGVWRHIIYSPASDNIDIIGATEHIYDLVSSSIPQFTLDLGQIQCINQKRLWYSVTEHTPLTFDSNNVGKNGETYHTSVPVSLGSLINFIVTIKYNSSSAIHFFTLSSVGTKIFFYLYAHTFYKVMDETNQKCFECSCSYEKRISTSSSVLSNLVLSQQAEHCPDKRCNLVWDTKFMDGHKSTIPSTQEGQIKTDFTAIKIMTYNIWNFNSYQQQGKYSQRLKKISQILQRAQPDIVGFQEVRFEQSSGGRAGPNQVQHLSSALPDYQFVYQPAQMMRESFEHGRSEEGLAIFSKYPIIHHNYLLLYRNKENSADGHQRICLHAVIYVPFIGRVHVFNTHLSLSHEAREVAVAQIYDFIHTESEENELVVLLGDLNATPEEKAVRTLSDGTGLVDVWSILHPSSQGLTFSTLEQRGLSKRIDYIFLRKSENVLAEKIEVLFDDSRAKAASDHRPVMATFQQKHMKHDNQ